MFALIVTGLLFNNSFLLLANDSISGLTCEPLKGAGINYLKCEDGNYYEIVRNPQKIKLQISNTNRGQKEKNVTMPDDSGGNTRASAISK